MLLLDSRRKFIQIVGEFFAHLISSQAEVTLKIINNAPCAASPRKDGGLSFNPSLRLRIIFRSGSCIGFLDTAVVVIHQVIEVDVGAAALKRVSVLDQSTQEAMLHAACAIE